MKRLLAPYRRSNAKNDFLILLEQLGPRMLLTADPLGAAALAGAFLNAAPLRTSDTLAVSKRVLHSTSPPAWLSLSASAADPAIYY